MSTCSRKNSQNISIKISSSLQSFKQVMGINFYDSRRHHHHHATTENTQKYLHHHAHLQKQKLQRSYSRHQNISNQHAVNSKRHITKGNVQISQPSVDKDVLYSVNDMLASSLSEKEQQIASTSTSDIVTRHCHFCSVRHNKTNSNNSNNISSTALIYMTSYSPATIPLPYTSAASSDNSSSKLSTLCTNCYTTCYKITLTAYNKITIMQLKCKTNLNRSINIGKILDRRYLCPSLLLLILIYWNTITHAAVAANVTDVVKIYNTALSSTSSLPLPVSTSQQSPKFVTNLSSFKLQGREHFAYNLTFNVRRSLIRRDTANVPDDEDNDQYDDEFHEYEILINNKSGKYIGAPCNDWKCETSLIHVTCNKETNTCGCEKNYPVQLGLIKGCDKPKKLGEQCFYDETCQYNDENSLCVQVRHNAMCQCASGFHSVSYTKPSRRVFCTQDLDELNSGVPTLLGVCLGIAVLAGLICMVLHLFSKTKYPRHRNYGDASLPPPIMYSSETGILLTVQSGRPSSRSSIRSSGGSIGSYGNRRSSSTTGGTGASKGILVSTSRTGSRRPSLASVHSTSSSVRSYSMMRFEKEQQQKEIRHEMKLRLARLQQQQHQQHHQQQLSQHRPQIIVGDMLLLQHGASLNRITMATPSPLTPNSMDELLPAVDETQEYLPKIENKTITTETSVASNTLTTLNRAITTTNEAETDIPGAAAAYVGPCSSSNETL